MNLTEQHRGGVNSTAFTGRSEGEKVRIDLMLDKKDKDSNLYEIVIPAHTTSFNPSFYLGLFFDSIKRLGGIDNFKKKYTIAYAEENAQLIEILKKNIEECERKANNEYIGKTGLGFL